MISCLLYEVAPGNKSQAGNRLGFAFSEAEGNFEILKSECSISIMDGEPYNKYKYSFMLSFSGLRHGHTTGAVEPGLHCTQHPLHH